MSKNFRQVQRLGRQILEALLFLQERGFPPFGHLHSGNVIIQNGVARYDNNDDQLSNYRRTTVIIIGGAMVAAAGRSIFHQVAAGHRFFDPILTGFFVPSSSFSD